nr:sulfurtransferase TusA family protein [Azospirillum formosense]
MLPHCSFESVSLANIPARQRCPGPPEGPLCPERWRRRREPGTVAASGVHAEEEVASVAAKELDVKGLHCPLPILRTRALLDKLAEGEEVIVYATDPASIIDFKHFCNTTDNVLLAHETRGEVFVYHIRRGASAA